MNSFLTPMLCTLIDKPFDDKNWLFEKKFDGIRCLAIINKKMVKLYSRNGNILNQTFPEIVKSLKDKSLDLILDGEIVSFEKNKLKTSFKNLQNRLNVEHPSQDLVKKHPVYFFIFDCLKKDRKDLRTKSLLERKKILKKSINFIPPLFWSEYVIGQGKALFKKAVKNGWEGIIGKKISSIYVGKRSRNWVKIKCEKSQEFIIIGYTLPKRSRLGFGALLLGYYDHQKKLHYVGKVGTGFSWNFLRNFIKKLKKIEIKHSLIDEKVNDAIWLSPKYVAQIKFFEKTRDNKLRHPVFLGLRKDKKAIPNVTEKLVFRTRQNPGI
jgi:bifunctional non-homologous end joining protein LigD